MENASSFLRFNIENNMTTIIVIVTMEDYSDFFVWPYKDTDPDCKALSK